MKLFETNRPGKTVPKTSSFAESETLSKTVTFPKCSPQTLKGFGCDPPETTNLEWAVKAKSQPVVLRLFAQSQKIGSRKSSNTHTHLLITKTHRSEQSKDE